MNVQIIFVQGRNELPLRLINHGKLNEDEDLTRHINSTKESIMNLVPKHGRH